MCHVGHASVTTYNAYHHGSTSHAYIQQSSATSIIEHVRASTTLGLGLECHVCHHARPIRTRDRKSKANTRIIVTLLVQWFTVRSW